MIDLAWAVIIKPFTIYEKRRIRFLVDRIWIVFFSGLALFAKHQDLLLAYYKFIFIVAIVFYLTGVVFLYIRERKNERKI